MSKATASLDGGALSNLLYTRAQACVDKDAGFVHQELTSRMYLCTAAAVGQLEALGLAFAALYAAGRVTLAHTANVLSPVVPVKWRDRMVTDFTYAETLTYTQRAAGITLGTAMASAEGLIDPASVRKACSLFGVNVNSKAIDKTPTVASRTLFAVLVSSVIGGTLWCLDRQDDFRLLRAVGREVFALIPYRFSNIYDDIFSDKATITGSAVKEAFGVRRADVPFGASVSLETESMTTEARAQKLRGHNVLDELSATQSTIFWKGLTITPFSKYQSVTKFADVYAAYNEIEGCTLTHDASSSSSQVASKGFCQNLFRQGGVFDTIVSAWKQDCQDSGCRVDEKNNLGHDSWGASGGIVEKPIMIDWNR